MTDDLADFTNLPDLASRALGGGVVYANDELFAEAANLLKPTPAVFSAESFGHKGKVYDGWETRRRREPGEDYRHRPPRRRRNRPRRDDRHGLVQGELPA